MNTRPCSSPLQAGVPLATRRCASRAALVAARDLSARELCSRADRVELLRLRLRRSAGAGTRCTAVLEADGSRLASGWLDRRVFRLRPTTLPNYGPQEWERHRAPSRYWRHLLSFPSSRLVRNLVFPTLFSVLWVSAMCVYSALAAPLALPPVPRVSGGLLSLFTSALSLLLVFRTNGSYQRFVESRQLWGVIVNSSRDLVRKTVTYFSNEACKRAMVRWVIALAHCTRTHMRLPRAEGVTALARILSPPELAAVAAAAHRPNFCLHMMSRIISAGCPDQKSALRLDEGLTRLTDAIGGTERLFRTPIPLSYTRHTSRLLIIWLACMPHALWSEFGLAALCVAPLLVWMLFGIDEIGVELEEPLQILPLETLCQAIEAQATELLSLDPTVTALVAASQAGAPDLAAA